MNKLRATPGKGNLLELCSGSVVLFAEKMLGLTLYSWQVKFLTMMQDSLENKTHNITAAITSRQIGKSTSVAVFALWCIVFNKKPGTIHNNTNVLIVSRSDEQARKLLREIRKHYRHGDRFMNQKYVDSDGKPLFGATGDDGKPIGFFTSLLSKDDPNNATLITLQHHKEEKHGKYLLAGSNYGSSIICSAPTPAVLGYTFSVGIVDEAGHETIRDEFWYDELLPTGDSTDAMWVFTSTPWKPTGFFYEYIDPYDEFGSDIYTNRIMFSIEALQNDDNERAKKQYAAVRKNIEEQYETKGRFAEIKRGWYCEFVKGDNNFFDPDKVHGVFDASKSMVYSYDGVCDMGVDFGGSGKSHTVITISTLDDDNNIIRLYHKRYEVDKDITLLSDIEELKGKFNIQRIVVDDCPAGWDRIKQMETIRYWNVVRFQFRKDKVSRYAAFKDKVYTGRVISYEDDDLKKEMLALENAKDTRQSFIQAARGYTDDLIDSWLISSYNYLEDTSVKFKFYSKKGLFEVK